MADLMARRRPLPGPSPSTLYDDPVHVVRSKGVWPGAGGAGGNDIPHVGWIALRMDENFTADRNGRYIDKVLPLTPPISASHGLPEGETR